MNFYAIYDLKAGYFLPVMEASGDDHAKRNIAEVIRQGHEQLAIHRNDYMLYCLGTYDNKSGKIVAYDAPEPVNSMDEIIQEYFPRQMQTDIEKAANGEYPDVTVEEMIEEQDSVYKDTPLPDDS
mgnify:FL=1